MKCPHCGMNIRDNIVVCGYCGGSITQQKERPASTGARHNVPVSGTVSKGAKTTKPPADESDEGEEEGDGLSKILEPGEQVLIGSLNISVKKFSFHAYMTNKRIFLIDTQEKKLKVTAKDVPRDTIVGSIVEFSENSDPVLVLSVKSIDDDIKTMKLVFTQNGVDRSSEIDDWIALLHEETKPKKSRRAPPVEEIPEVEEEAEEPVRALKPVQKQELHPTKKPIKDYEKQPPVKRLLTSYTVPEPEPQEEEPEPERPPRRTQFRMVEEPVKRSGDYTTIHREVQSIPREETKPVKKPEVHSAMKYAMKSPLQPVRQPVVYPVRKPVSEPARRIPETEPTEEIAPVERHAVQKSSVSEEGVESPQFCHNCGKKLPHSANFCPGCGTKLGQYKPGSTTVPRSSHNTVSKEKTPAERTTYERKTPKIEDIDDDGESSLSKPPIKKAPKGSDMTILHKFLRR
ncbi:MAG: zinc ribbon domain-containing protein [Methanoregula sp.]|nr:zinc ribbon domain-containing protein [Methanoregula sp.]